MSIGAVTRAATMAADGTWSVGVSSAEIPAGEYTATATDLAGSISTLTQDVVIDTIANSLSIDRPVEGDDVINSPEAADAVVLSGPSVPGAMVQVTLDGVTHSAVANRVGAWQTFFAASEVQPGTYEAKITATLTDAAGHAHSITETVQVDTQVDNPSVAAESVETDGLISHAECADGLVITGTVEPGSTVEVTIGSETVAATVDSAGHWSASVSAAALADGQYTGDVVVKATDAAGNMAMITDGVQVEIGASVIVTFNGVDLPATMAADGTWSVLIPASAIAAGRYDATITITATDAVGSADSSYLARDDETVSNTVDLSNPSLGTYQIDAVDLQFSEEATLSLTEAQIIELSETSDELTIHGGAGDTGQIAGAARTGSTVVGSQRYETCTNGEATLILDSDTSIEETPVI